MNRPLRLLLCLALTAGLAAPAAAQFNPLSIIKGAVEAAVEDRSADDIAIDSRIKTEITAEVLDKMAGEVISINADVYEQDVMLTGVVDDGDKKVRAATLVRTVEGVKKIYNEIRVIKPLEKKKGAVEGFVDDTVIDQKINALLLDASGVSVTNFRWRAVQGHVYLFGRALSQAELDKAVGVVKGIKNVLSVTVRAKVRPKA